jgi:hypothetical protein
MGSGHWSGDSFHLAAHFAVDDATVTARLRLQLGGRSSFCRLQRRRGDRPHLHADRRPLFVVAMTLEKKYHTNMWDKLLEVSTYAGLLLVAVWMFRATFEPLRTRPSAGPSVLA